MEKIVLEIDNREPIIFKNEFINKNNCVFKNLDQGDLIFKKYYNLNDFEILIIVERKSIEDLLSSVKDNRYNDQITRFNNLNIDNRNIIYIIEGNKNRYFKESSEYKCLNSCIFTLLYKNKFQVIFTNDIDDSINFINNLFINLSILKSKKNSNSNNVVLLKKIKINKEDWEKYIINLIPNIGIKTSENILKYFNNSFLHLIEEYKNNNLLFNQMLINNKKINKNIIQNLQLFINHLIK